jgi:chromosome segregation ATPase
VLKKALNSEDYETEKERKLYEMIETLSNQLKMKLNKPDQKVVEPNTVLINGQLINHETNIIKTTKEEYDKTQHELATRRTELSDLTHTLSTERNQLYTLQEQNQYLKKEYDTLQRQTSNWPHERDQYLEARKALEKDLAREKLDKEMALKTLENKLQLEWKDKQKHWQQQTIEMEKYWKLKESKFDEKQSSWESLEKKYIETNQQMGRDNQTLQEEIDQLKLKQQASELALQKQLEEEKKDKEKIAKLQNDIKKYYVSLQKMTKEKENSKHQNPNPTLYTPQ